MRLFRGSQDPYLVYLQGILVPRGSGPMDPGSGVHGSMDHGSGVMDPSIDGSMDRWS